MKLAQARLVTGDVPALARFYEAILGVAPIGSEDYVELRVQGSTLAISSKRSVDLFNAGAAEPAANRSVILDFEVKDVDQERSRLRDVVGEFVLEPTDQPWGSRSMLFRDPDGNLINFFAPLAGARVNRSAGSSLEVAEARSWNCKTVLCNEQHRRWLEGHGKLIPLV